MNNEQWLIEFDLSKDKFKWFFIKYGFEIEWNKLLELRKMKQVGKMKTVMDVVWFELPDDEFNIKMNPDGWNEFLRLIED
jgi:hypothetical protein